MIVKTFDGKKIGLQRINRKPRKIILRAQHQIGVLPDGRELVKFNDEWFWLLKGANQEEIEKVDKLISCFKIL